MDIIIFVQENGVDLLNIRGVTNCEKYALALMNALFSDEELAISCYSTSKRSKKPPLSDDKVSLLEGVYTYYNLYTLIIHGPNP